MLVRKIEDKDFKLLKECGIDLEDVNGGLVFELEKTYIIFDLHEQDCCERVYADWKAIDHQHEEIYDYWNDYNSINDFVKENIELVENAGFRIYKKFVPCYNSQNGYYSHDLELFIFCVEELDFVKLDLKKFMFDDIN
jgi:hypothetical protein